VLILLKQNYIPQYSGGEMPAKRLALIAVSILVFVTSALAQKNEVSVTGGRTFVSTQTVQSTGLPLHFGNAGSFAFNYSHFLKRYKIFGISAELPVAIYPRMDVNYPLGTTAKDFGALFVTPSVRVNIFSGEGVSPWVSLGGGYGRFRQAPVTLYEEPNTGPGGGNTGVLQIGTGLDVWPWQHWGARLEARDFYSGTPDLNVATGRSRQHNYYVGVGVIFRF
jgi:hypothetical protein